MPVILSDHSCLWMADDKKIQGVIAVTASMENVASVTDQAQKAVHSCFSCYGFNGSSFLYSVSLFPGTAL